MSGPWREYGAPGEPSPPSSSGPWAPSCPCGGRCHHDTHPCSLGCWYAQKPWLDAEALAVAMNTAQVEPDELRLGHDLRVPAERILRALESAVK